MNKNISLFIFFFSVFNLKTNAQSYWQQQNNYVINVSLNDQQNILSGNIKIEYTNNSPNALDYIYFHLWPNAFKDNTTEFAKQMLQQGKTSFLFSTDEEKGFMDSLSFYVNGKPASFLINEDTIDIGKLLLNQPLTSGSTISITTSFRVKIPKTFSRLGHDEQQYQITQWYPKPAVYDGSGWHPIPYLDQGEFYGDYGSFDVNITLPKNYVVGATGELQTQSEIKFLNELADTSNHKKDSLARNNDFPKSSTETKTLHYTASNVHDFAWFADKRYLVLKSKVELSNKQTVTTWLMFTPRGRKLWKDAIPFINGAITHYSQWVGNYPYKNVTAVEGKLEAGGGMEYPQITVIGRTTSKSELETVIVHEVGHNWFQGMLGSNERQHAWMDEGINSYYEQRYTKEFAKKDKPTKEKPKGISINLANVFDNSKVGNSLAYLGYAYSAWRNEDQPCELPAAQYSPINYFGDVYGKTPLLFNYLANTIGQEEFDRIMKIYFQQFQYKHPQPADIKKVFDENCKQNLDWFWNDAINTNKKFDLRLKNIHRTIEKVGKDEFYKITIVNKSNIRTPYSVSALIKDSIVKTINYGGFLGEMDVLFPKGNYDKLKIDALNNIPELDRQNNTSKISGIFRKTEPLHIGLLSFIRQPNKNQIGFVPLIGYNVYNGLMPGLMIYNPLLPGNLWEYQLVPMIGLKDKQFAFTGKIQRNWRVNKTFINCISAGVGANYFDEGNYTELYSEMDGSSSKMNFSYLRIKPFIEFNLKPQQLNSSVTQKLTLVRNIYQEKAFDNSTATGINILNYEVIDKQNLNPQTLLIQLQQTDRNAKITLTFEAAHLYKRNKYLSARFFAGFVHNEGLNQFDLKMSGFRGSDDYLHDNMYGGRNERSGFWAHQMYMQEGGFRQATWSPNPYSVPNVGRSNSLLSALNLTADLPINLPLALYADLGFYSLDNIPSNDKHNFLYDGGIVLRFTKNIQINFPLLACEDFRDNYNYVFQHKSDFNKWASRITFVFNINNFNPIKAIQNFNMN